MLANLKNIFGRSTQPNAYRSVSGGPAEDFWVYDRSFGHIIGLDDAFTHMGLLKASEWKTTLNSGTWVPNDGHPLTTSLVTAATANNQIYGLLSKDGGTTAWLPFQITTAGHLLRARKTLKVDSVANSQVLFGFTDNTAPWSAGAINTANGIYWRSSAGGAMTAELAKSSTRTAQTTDMAGNAFTAMAADTYITLGILADSQTGVVKFYLNDRLVYRQTTLTNLPAAGTQLSLVLAVNPQTAAARTLTYKQGYARQEAA